MLYKQTFYKLETKYFLFIFSSVQNFLKTLAQSKKKMYQKKLFLKDNFKRVNYNNEVTSSIK